jgi:hypothetical protein
MVSKASALPESNQEVTLAAGHLSKKQSGMFGLERGKAGRMAYSDSGADLLGFRNTKTCIRRNAAKVAGGSANSLAIKTLVVKLDRQKWTMVIVVNQLATTTAEYCMSCRI